MRTLRVTNLQSSCTRKASSRACASRNSLHLQVLQAALPQSPPHTPNPCLCLPARTTDNMPGQPDHKTPSSPRRWAVNESATVPTHTAFNEGANHATQSGPSASAGKSVLHLNAHSAPQAAHSQAARREQENVEYPEYTLSPGTHHAFSPGDLPSFITYQPRQKDTASSSVEDTPREGKDGRRPEGSWKDGRMGTRGPIAAGNPVWERRVLVPNKAGDRMSARLDEVLPCPPPPPPFLHYQDIIESLSS